MPLRLNYKPNGQKSFDKSWDLVKTALVAAVSLLGKAQCLHKPNWTDAISQVTCQFKKEKESEMARFNHANEENFARQDGRLRGFTQ